MLVTRQWMREKYEYYNNLLWNGELPSISFIINNSRKTWGYATYRFDLWNDTVYATSITMSNKFDSPEKVKLATLIHEMIHIADYTFNPHHFVRNGRKVSGRSYDAHGYIYFIPQMNRINKMLANEGIVISTHVTEEERSQSELNPVEKARIKNKIDSGVHVLVSKLKNPTYKSYEYTMAVVQNTMLGPWINYVTTSDWWASEFLYTDDYLTDNETLAMRRSKKVGISSYLTISVDNLIEKYNLKLNRRIYDSESNEPDEPEVEPIKPQETPVVNNQPHLVPVFRFKTSQGDVIELKNKTKEEIETFLRGKFPNWPDKTIETIMNHKSCYPMGENKIKLTESDIVEMVEEVVDNLTDTSKIPGQRRSKVKQVGQYEYEESIE